MVGLVIAIQRKMRSTEMLVVVVTLWWMAAETDGNPLYRRTHPQTNAVNHHHHRQSGGTVSKSCLLLASSASTVDRCEFYSCAGDELHCPAMANSAAGRMCRAVDQLRSQLDPLVLEWAERTMDCVTQRLRHQLLSDRQTPRANSVVTHGACANVDFRLRTDLHACAQLTDAELCTKMLWEHRHSMLKLFSDINWLWLVEIARSCPRPITTRFITWAIAKSDDTAS